MDDVNLDDVKHWQNTDVKHGWQWQEWATP